MTESECGHLGSARVSRVGERVPAIADFFGALFLVVQNEIQEKFVSARRRNQHARRVRYPILRSRGTC
jgi:hypothetical protein